MEKGSKHIFSTGIGGFDEVLGRGIPRHSMTLFLEDVGSETNIVALQMLWHRLKEGDLCIIWDFDSPPKDLREKMKSYGWDVKKYEEEGSFILADMFTHAFDLGDFYPEEKYFCKRPNDLTYIANFVSELREELLKRRVSLKYFGVILSAARLLNFYEEKDVLKALYSTGMKYRTLGNAVLIIDPRMFSQKGLALLENFAGTVVRFYLEKNDNSFIRKLRVIKSSLFGYVTEPVTYTITQKEGVLLYKEKLDRI